MQSPANGEYTEKLDDTLKCLWCCCQINFRSCRIDFWLKRRIYVMPTHWTTLLNSDPLEKFLIYICVKIGKESLFVIFMIKKRNPSIAASTSWTKISFPLKQSLWSLSIWPELSYFRIFIDIFLSEMSQCCNFVQHHTTLWSYI